MKRALEKEVKDSHPHSQFVNQLTATYKTFFRNLATQFGRDRLDQLRDYGICVMEQHPAKRSATAVFAPLVLLYIIIKAVFF